MGEYFLIVNPVKRQYINASRFGENIKRSGLFQGLHGVAVALLLCDTKYPVHPLEGSWLGDPIIVTGDGSEPNTALIQTSTEGEPERNLYETAFEEFEDISQHAIVMVCEDRSERIAALVNASKDQSYLLIELGDIVFELD